MILVLIVSIPVLLIIMGRFFGDFWPGVLFFGTAAFMVFVMPSVPGSPIACLNHPGDPCNGHMTWVVSLVFVVPLCLAVAYKTLRGDGRGTKGTWRGRRRRALMGSAR